mmetsp:Transcript_107172/g.268638  ORF Transcript_107172/g.268638 Transcript_107172/m.268638 type:complete len:528 (+) Transcript_107172:1916-3499(+)
MPHPPAFSSCFSICFCLQEAPPLQRCLQHPLLLMALSPRGRGHPRRLPAQLGLLRPNGPCPLCLSPCLPLVPVAHRPRTQKAGFPFSPCLQPLPPWPPPVAPAAPSSAASAVPSCHSPCGSLRPPYGLPPLPPHPHVHRVPRPRRRHPRTSFPCFLSCHPLRRPFHLCPSRHLSCHPWRLCLCRGSTKRRPAPRPHPPPCSQHHPRPLPQKQKPPTRGPHPHRHPHHGGAGPGRAPGHEVASQMPLRQVHVRTRGLRGLLLDGAPAAAPSCHRCLPVVVPGQRPKLPGPPAQQLDQLPVQLLGQPCLCPCHPCCSLHRCHPQHLQAPPTPGSWALARASSASSRGAGPGSEEASAGRGGAWASASRRHHWMQRLPRCPKQKFSIVRADVSVCARPVRARAAAALGAVVMGAVAAAMALAVRCRPRRHLVSSSVPSALSLRSHRGPVRGPAGCHRPAFRNGIPRGRTRGHRHAPGNHGHGHYDPCAGAAVEAGRRGCLVDLARGLRRRPAGSLQHRNHPGLSCSRGLS